MADYVIRNGLIVDGTGSAPFIGDLAVKDGLITEVGTKLATTGAREIDATGKHVTPGWIDPHTHYDAQVMWDPMVTPSADNGVTTVVMGNCAVGIAPCPKPLRGFVTDLCDAIEDIPAPAINSLENFWQWETFPEYMAHMETKSFACDIGVLVGHAPVRTWVMGAKANASDIPGGRESAPLNDEDIARMRKVVQEAVAAGAVGFSSSRVSIHRDASGVLLPGSLAEHKELEEMAKGVADGGGGVFELASSWNLYDDFVKEGVGDRDKLRDYYNSDWEWLNRMATTPGLTVTTGGGTGGMEKDQAWQFAAPGGQMERLANVHANGGDMWITPMMRLGTLFIGIKGEGLNPLLASAAYQEVLKAAGGYVTDDMIMELQSNLGLRATIIDELEQVRTGAYGTHFIGNKSQRQWIWPWSTDPENAEEDSLLFAAENPKVWGGEGGKTVWEYVYDVMVHPEEPHGGVLVRPLYNYGDHSFEPLMDMFLGNDKIVAGFADGGAHGKGQCEATTPTTLITFWCRDRTRGEHIPIEIIVKKQTKDSANMMGFHDRGELRPGFRADLNVFDLETLDVKPPEYVNDMPLNAGRWVQPVTGYDLTMCHGVITFEHGQPTGALPGRVAKNPRANGIIANGLRGSVEPGDSEGLTNAADLSEFAAKLQSEGMGASAIMKTLDRTSGQQSKL